jgi:hypothetical protein
MGVNKKMPSQEIGLYRMAKEKNAQHEAKEMVEKAMTIASAMRMSKEMTAPMHRIIIKKK